MKSKLVFLLITVLFYLTGNSQILTNTYFATDDAQVNSGATTTNYGSVDTTQVFFKQSPIGNSIYRTFIQFDLSNIPSEAIIISAKLKLYPKTINNTLNHPIYIERVDTAWDESSITYANAPATISSDKVSISHSNTTNTTVHEFSVKAHVEYMTNYSYLNNGWRIRLQTESGASSFGINYYSSEYSNSAKHPQLVVEYILPIKLSTQVTHCTAGNTDGSISVDLTGGTQMQTSYISIHKVVRSTTAIGDATLTNVTSGSSVSYNSTTKKISASNLAPGVYRLLVHDSLYYAASDIKYRFYKYFLVGREGETISGILYPSESYQEDVRLAYDKPTASSPTDLANTNQSGYTNLYVTDLENNYEYASLIQYELDFDPKLEFTKAELQIKAANKFYHGTTSTNELNYSLVTSPWEEKVVTWNSRPTIDSAFFVYLPETLIVGYDSLDLWDTVSVIPFVEFWQQNPDENYGFEMALLDYTQTQYASRNYKGANSNENFICFEFTVKPDIETIFIDSIRLGNIIVNAPAGELPFKYLIGTDTLPELDTIWYAIRDSISIDSASFYQGNVNTRNFTFGGMEAGRYFIGVYDNNGEKILDAEAVLSPEILVYYSVDMKDTLDEFSVDSPADSARATLLGLLVANEDGGFGFEVTNLDGKVLIGFNREFDTIPYMDRFFEYSLEIDSTGDFEVRESGSLLTSGTTTIGDRFRMMKTEGEILVYKNDIEIISDSYPISHRAYKVEVVLKGPSAVLSKLHFVGGLLKPKPVVATVAQPECPDLEGTVTVTLPPVYFKYQYPSFTITNLITSTTTSGTTNGSYSLPVGVYSISYHYQQYIGGVYVSSVYGGYEEFAIGYMVDWFYVPADDNIHELTGTNTLTPINFSFEGDAVSYNASPSSDDWWYNFKVSRSVGGALTQHYVKIKMLNDDGVAVELNIEPYIYSGILTKFISLTGGGFVMVHNNLPITINQVGGDISIINHGTIILPTSGIPIPNVIPGSLEIDVFEKGKVFLSNNIVSYCLPDFVVVNNGYVRVQKVLDGGYYDVGNHLLLFEVDVEYYTQSTTYLDYAIYTTDLELIAGVSANGTVVTGGAPLLLKHLDKNGYELDLAALSLPDGYYVFETTNSKGEKTYVRFKLD